MILKKVSFGALAALLLSFTASAIALLSSPNLFADVGYYIGSFDPPTLGHKAVAVKAIEQFNFEKLYVTVNWNTDKDFNTSVDERVDMLKRLFAEYGDRVVILREPLEGRPEFARYLNTKYDGKVIGVFGDDTYDKNFKIFNGIENFDFIKVHRPEVQLESAYAESVYVPIIHNVEVVADGLSSSLARDLIAKGKDASRVLSTEVMSLIRHLGLYAPVPPEQLPARQADFMLSFSAFVSGIRDISDGLFDFSGFEPPKFKAGQSVQAQQDKFIRWAITQKKMTVEEQLVFRPYAEKLFAYSSRSVPLRSSGKAGLYYGSFDFPTVGQKEVIVESIRQLGLDVIYVAPLESSPKDLNASLRERQQMLQLLVADLGLQVRVLPSAPSQEGRLRRFVERVANEHSSPLVAIFGENVFEKNYRLLQGVPRVQFAVVPRPSDAGADFKVPQGVSVVKTSNHGIPSTLGDALPPLESLTPGVLSYVESQGLYQKQSPSAFSARFREFIRQLSEKLPFADFSAVGEPPFKATQTLEGQADKFVRWVTEKSVPGVSADAVHAAAVAVYGDCPRVFD